jgi:hypothetical protein
LNPDPGTTDPTVLYGVAALSDCTAWAVGLVGDYYEDPVIEYWDGTAWTIQVTNSAGIGGEGVFGVAATSSTNAWAVGTYESNSYQPLDARIMAWDGTRWQDQSISQASASEYLRGVAATSSTNAWAVGNYVTRAQPFGLPLIERWNGHGWKKVTPPGCFLNAVAATSASKAWAVGSTGGDGLQFPLILRWARNSWRKAHIPAVSTGGILDGVAATSATSAWAVSQNVNQVILILRWNGRTWKRAGTPRAARGASLNGITATSGRNAWAVGTSRAGKTLILHWNGRAWT